MLAGNHGNVAASASGAGLSPDLRKRIEIMAEHISRNGPDFESTVKQKNVNNPQFAFLYNGEGAEYYSQVLAAHRGGSSVASGSAGTSDSSTLPHPSAATSDFDVPELLERWKEPPGLPVSAEVERQLGELIASLEQMASRDAVRNGRVWIESNAAIAQQIAGHLVKRIVFLPTCSHRLHILYLVHDVLQTEAAQKESKESRQLIRAFKGFLVWLLRPSYQLAQSASPNGEESGRVLRLLHLWVERNILTARESEEIKYLVTLDELPSAPKSHESPQASGHRALPRQVQSPVPSNQSPMAAHGMMGAGRGGRPLGVPVVGRHMGMPPGPPGTHPSVLAAQRPYIGGVMPGMLPGQAPFIHMYPAAGAVAPRTQAVQTPESVPVGVMATMLLQFMRLHKARKIDYVHYKPLDPAQTPQMLPPMEVPNQRLLERVEDFYDDLKDEERDASRSSSSSRSSSRSRSRSASARRQREASGGAFMAVAPPPIA